VSRRLSISAVVAAATLPRLAVVLVEQDQVIGGLPEKSDRFARTLVESGTFGFIVGVPSGYTQPLYAFFLAPQYWLFGHSWAAVGVSQTVVAAGTAVLVYLIGERVVSARVGLVAALLSTLHPYLIWHDVHVNREVLDSFLAALVTLLVVIAGERTSIRLAAAAGAATGLAVLGNARLAMLPVALAAYLAWSRSPRREAVLVAGALVAAAALVVAPWVVRNRVSVGCYAITTDARALWKANNPATYGVLAGGGWIDQVPELPGGPPWPELAADRTAAGRPTTVDECAQMRLYRDEVLRFWRDHPGEKARLAAQAVRMLWSPVVTVEEDVPAGGLSGLARTVVEPVYFVVVAALALLGLARLRRRFLALTLLLLAYGTVMAMVFAGTVRYRAPWDFLLCLPAAVTLVHGHAALASRRRRSAVAR
jgi:4-amino-4-deoxy-L-arabinose transferase-like glycosyltransferase